MSDAPLPWSVRGCARHPERTDLACYRVRDANGDVVLGATVFARMQELQLENRDHHERWAALLAFVNARRDAVGIRTLLAEMDRLGKEGT